jgi:hypothetical protein
MNTQPYKGIAPRTTPALRARRYLVQAIGQDAVDAMDTERVEYYRNLIRKVRAS